MKRWFTLLRVEFYKLRTRKLTWILLILMMVLAIFSVGMTKLTRNIFEQTQTAYNEDTGEFEVSRVEVQDPPPIERSDVEELLITKQQRRESMELAPDYAPHNADILTLDAEITALRAHLDEGILETSDRDNIHRALYANTPYNSMLIVMVIILATSLAGEFTTGTMKQMFTRPFSRTQILSAKFVAAQLYALGLIIAHYVVFLIAYGLIFGWDLSNPMSVFVWGDTAIFTGIAQHALLIHLMTWLSLWLVGALAMAIAVWTRSTAAVIGLTVALCFLAAPIVKALTGIVHALSWLPFVFFDLRPSVQIGAHVIESARSADLLGLMFAGSGVTIAYGITPALLLLGWFVYLILFTALAVLGFRTRDI